jgi:hypothetical protein
MGFNLLKTLTEQEIQPNNRETKVFLKKWSHGNMMELENVTATIRNELKATVQDDTLVLYRGWKFEDWSSMKERLGTTNIKAGDQLTLNSNKLRSWTKSEHVSTLFSDPKYDSISGNFHEDEDLEEMGYTHGEMIGISVVLKCTVSKEKVLADLTNLPPAFLSHGHDEEEVILEPGVFKCSVLSVHQHRHASPFSKLPKMLSREYEEFIKKAPEFKGKKFTFDEFIEELDNQDYELDVGVCAILMASFGMDDEESLAKIKKMSMHADEDAAYVFDVKHLDLLKKYIAEFWRSGADQFDLHNDYRFLVARGTSVSTHSLTDDGGWEPDTQWS